MSGSPSSESRDWDALVRMIRNGSKEERQEAWGKLERLIRQLARGVVAKFSSDSRQVVEEFIEEAPSIIFERLDKFDGIRRFKPWVAQVLKNALRDRFRSDQRRHKRERLVGKFVPPRSEDDEEPIINPLEPITPDSRPKTDWRLDFEAFFEQSDFVLLENQLRPRARVFSLIMAGLWSYVPVHLQERWLAEVPGLPDPFPPPEIASLEEPNERLNMLVEVLNEQPSTLRMIWHRARPVLQKLKRGRHFFGEGEG
jgi:RNA polymerase sigma factor (sigma-70 family)